MNATAIKLVVRLWHDDCPMDPTEYDWKVYSFSHRHSNFKHPDDFRDDEDFARKRHEGFAFPLSYYEHGQCLWSLVSELPAGARCPWDSVTHAGFIVWEQDEADLSYPDLGQGESFLKRQEDARRFIERYTMWCNGEIFGYTIDAYSKCGSCGQDEEADVDFDLPSCGGWYANDIDGMVADMKGHIGDDWKDYEVTFKDPFGGFLADEIQRLWEKDSDG
jgi:hypothetical protein